MDVAKLVGDEQVETLDEAMCHVYSEYDPSPICDIGPMTQGARIWGPGFIDGQRVRRGT